MSCIAKINESYNLLSKNEKQVADYIKENYPFSMNYSIQKLSSYTGISTSCIMRFVKKLGYNGYADFKLGLARDYSNTLQSGNFLDVIHETDTLDEMIQKSKQLNQQTFDKAYSILNVNNLEAAIELLHKSHRIFVIGESNSSLIGMDFCWKLININYECISIFDSHIELTQLLCMRPDDVVIIISYSGKTNIANIALKKAIELGVPTIVVTRITSENLTKNCTIPLCVPHLEEEIRLGSIAARYSLMIIMDLLYLGLAKLDMKKTYRLLKENIDFLQTLKVNV